MKFQDKIAVVTGGVRGLSKSICLALAREGASVVVAANVPSEVDEVASAVKVMDVRAISFVLEVTKPEEVGLLVKSTIESSGRLSYPIPCWGCFTNSGGRHIRGLR